MSLYYRTTPKSLSIEDEVGNKIAEFTQTGAELWYNGAQKLLTQSGGAKTNGTHTATDFNSTSSRRFKKAIRSLSESVARRFDRVRWVSYEHRKNFDGSTGRREYGIVAEELAEVYPEAVTFDERGLPLAYSHNTMFGILGKTLEATRAELRAVKRELAEVRGH